MKAVWTGWIWFGLVNIPIKLYSAVRDSELDFDFLDKKDHSRIRYLRVNEKTGKEVAWSNIIRGYKLNNKWVVLDEADFEKASPRQTKAIEISDFVEEKEIDSLYYEMPYYLEPETSGAKAYVLLREALKKTGKVAVASYVMRTKQSLAVIKPMDQMLVLVRIRFREEIRDHSDLKIPARADIKPSELKMAVTLINQYSKPFNIDSYKDTYSAHLLKLIKAKAKGIKTPEPALRVVHSKNRDLMDQLKASLNHGKRKKAS